MVVQENTIILKEFASLKISYIIWTLSRFQYEGNNVIGSQIEMNSSDEYNLVNKMGSLIELSDLICTKYNQVSQKSKTR